jgi:hypothetical protein
MDHRYIRDHQIVDQYLRNQLPEVEAASFEEHYFDCPECLDELEVAKSFGEGIHDGARPPRPAGNVRNRWLMAFALSAAALIIVFAAAYLVDQSRTRAETALAAAGAAGRDPVAAAQQAQTPVVVYRMSMERSAASSARVIQLPQAPSVLAFALEFAGPLVPGYHAELRGAAGLVWESSQVRPDPNGALTIRVHSTMLAAGDYSIRIDGITREGSRLPVAEFPFRADAHH